MTWRLVHQYPYDVEETVKGEWSDSEIGEAAQKIHTLKTKYYDDDMIFIFLKEFLPEPIRDAL